MSDNQCLFGDEPEPTRASAPAVATTIADWQVDLVRKALDARGLTTTAERQTTIEAAVGWPVESLRALTFDEGLRVLSQLGQQPARNAEASAWDERDEDTWIDRL